MVDLLGKKSHITATLHQQMDSDLAGVNRKIRVVESRIESINEHLSLVDKNIIDKHKTEIKEVRELEEDIRNLRGEISKTKAITDRIIERMKLFATNENLKVLERYINLWQPLKYVTKEEVEKIVRRILIEKGDN